MYYRRSWESPTGAIAELGRWRDRQTGKRPGYRSWQVEVAPTGHGWPILAQAATTPVRH